MTTPAPPKRRPIVDAPVTGARLSDREQEVLQRMARGLTNAEIGLELSLAEDTIKTHARRLFRKIRARDRAHAVALGYQTGLLGQLAAAPPPPPPPPPPREAPTGQAHLTWCAIWRPQPCNCRGGHR